MNQRPRPSQSRALIPLSYGFLEYLAEAVRLELTQVFTRCLSGAEPYQLGDASLFEDWRRVRDSNSQAHYARQFSRLRPYQLGLTLREIIWQERQDLNPHSSVLETDALIQLSYTPRNLVHGEGLEPPKSVKTSDLQSDAFAALRR